jgi:Putative restriction endonuclease
MAIEVDRARRFTADEFERMVELGIFREDERLELIDGGIVEMAPIGHRHGACVAQLNQHLVAGVRDRALVWVHGLPGSRPTRFPSLILRCCARARTGPARLRRLTSCW